MVPNPITRLLGDVEMHRGVDLLSKVSAEPVQFSPLSTLTEGERRPLNSFGGSSAAWKKQEASGRKEERMGGRKQRHPERLEPKCWVALAGALAQEIWFAPAEARGGF